MIGALLYWRLHSLRNRVVAWVVRLRQPKYLASFLAGAAYIYFIFLRRVHFGGGPAHTLTAPSLNGRTVTVSLALPAALISEVGGFLLLAYLFGNAFFIWSAAAPEARLKFTEAEIAFLFPAPLSRRRLIHFNLISTELTVLISSLFLTLITDRGSFLGGNALTHAVGWWIILSSVSLYQNALTFVASRAVERFGPRAKRNALVLLTLGALYAVRALWLTARAPSAIDPRVLTSTFVYLTDWLRTGLGAGLVRPFAWVIAPFAAPTFGAFLLALGPALLFPALCYAVILGLQVPFRDGSIAAAGRRAQQRAAQRAIGTPRGVRAYRPRRSPFALKPGGRPEVAFLWKNLIGIQSWFNLRVVLVILIAGALVMVNVSHAGRSHSNLATATVVLTVAAIAGFYVMLLGPQLIRQDLRSDLPNADVLKVYPLRGWQIVSGQMLTPALLLSLLMWLTALVAGWAFLSTAQPGSPITFGMRLAGLICVCAVIPAVTLLQLVIPNAAALLFPGWHQAVRTRGGGIEAIGQRLLFTFGQFLGVLVALLPAALTAPLIVVSAVGWGLGVIPGLAAATLFALAVILGEVWVGLWWLGERFERLDIALELKP
ncbi:MAG TPA: hypothetical protein VFE31_05680 [Opitutaceae bacterium]|nr:hypothetical protein [Opitutaceae bacterium]